MLAWTRVENWELETPKFVELAVDGAVLWMREGILQRGRRPRVARYELGSAAEAEAALKRELAKLRRRKFGELTTVQRAAPSPEELDPNPDPALANPRRWPEAEANAKKHLFYERLAAIGVDPLASFVAQASRGGRQGSDGANARDRDADARASAALRIAKEVLGVRLTLRWQDAHDGKSLSDVYGSAAQIFAIISHLKR
jgi:hypothetical protein